MIRPNRSHASLGVALALGLSALVVAPGCEIIASFDRSKIDAGEEQEDAAPYDASYPDGSPGTDANPPEAGTNDAGDASQPADGAIDSTVSDAGDANVPDANTADAADANTADTGVTDSSTPDANDANIPDADDAALSEASDDGATE